LVVLAASTYFLAAYVGKRSAQAISFPIDLRVGTTKSPSFRADYSEPYEVGLEVERRLPFERLNCLLGVYDIAGPPRLPSYCGPADSPLDLSWTVYENGRVVGRGATDVGQYASYGPTVTRTISTVNLRPLRTYRIEVTSRRDASVLAPTHPRVTLAVHPMVWLGEWQFRSLAVLVAIGLGILGLGLLGLSAVRWILRAGRRA
jgi:hypothetical protein